MFKRLRVRKDQGAPQVLNLERPTPVSINNISAPFVALCAGAAVTGLSPIFVRLSEVGPIATAFYRIALALPVLMAFMLLQTGTPKSTPVAKSVSHGYFVAAGGFFAADLIFWHWSIQLTLVANATLLASIAPVFVSIAATVLFKERPNQTFVVGLALAIFGATVLIGKSSEFDYKHFIGDILGISTATCYAAYLLTAKKLRQQFSATHTMFYAGLYCAAILLPAAILSGEKLLPESDEGWTTLFFLAWVSHAAGQGLIAYALKHLTASFSSVTLLLQPVVAGAIAWALFNERLTLIQIVGALIIIYGIYICGRAARVETNANKS